MTDRAIKYLEEYETKATELDDMEGQGKAYQALAAAYQVPFSSTPEQFAHAVTNTKWI